VAKQFLDGMGVNGRGHGEHLAGVNTAVGDQHMQVGVVSSKSSKVWMAMTAPGTASLCFEQEVK